MESSKQCGVYFSIRPYRESSDAKNVDELEKLCEAGPSGSASLFTDLMGDPLCRVRHFPHFEMLVAELDVGDGQMEIVGMIRAGLKVVTCGKRCGRTSGKVVDSEDIAPAFAPTAYILGLRVSPRYRRLGIGAALVKRMEQWCISRGAYYTYFATEKDNDASVNLFTLKFGYSKFCTPAILVQPVYMRSRRVHPRAQIVALKREEAETLYREAFRETEFFPVDVDAIMRSRLHKGTWIAFWKDGKQQKQGNVADDLSSWAVLSMWKCNEIFRLEVKGAGLLTRSAVGAARFVGKLLRKVLTVPTPPNVFRPFGLQLLYGLHCHGARGPELLTELCWFAHNMAKKDGCAVVAAEVGSCDPLRSHIPHWSSLSCDEDLWCIKRLASSADDEGHGIVADHDDDWSRRPPPLSPFVDPRDF